MSLRNYLKGIADALRDNGAYSEQEDGKINAQEFAGKIYEVAESKHSTGIAEGYGRGQEDGYANGHEEGYIEGYKQGGLDASPQETISGEAIGITDISPIEHNMGVKVSGVEDLSKVKLYKQGKNIINIDKGLNNVLTKNDDGTYTITKVSANSGGFSEKIPFEFPTASYSFYAEVVDTNTTRTGIKAVVRVDSNSSDAKYPVFGTTGRITTIPHREGYALQLYIDSENQWDYITFKNPQVVVSDTPITEFEPYIEPTVYDVPADGIVEGVKSLYPSTTLYTDTSGAVIDCTYYQDGKKVKENLIDMILELGGVINE